MAEQERPTCFLCLRRQAYKSMGHLVEVGGLKAHKGCIYELGVIEAGKRARKLKKSQLPPVRVLADG
jgi:hypothetical protein